MNDGDTRASYKETSKGKGDTNLGHSQSVIAISTEAATSLSSRKYDTGSFLFISSYPRYIIPPVVCQPHHKIRYEQNESHNHKVQSRYPRQPAMSSVKCAVLCFFFDPVTDMCQISNLRPSIIPVQLIPSPSCAIHRDYFPIPTLTSRERGQRWIGSEEENYQHR